VARGFAYGKALMAAKTAGEGKGYVAMLMEKMILSCSEGRRPQMSK